MPSTIGLARPLSPSAGDGQDALGAGAIAGLVLIAALTAVCYPLLSVGLAYAPPFQFATLRVGIGGVMLLLLALLARRPFPRGRKVWILLAISGVSTTSVGFISMFTAAGMVAPGMATVVSGTQPIVAAVLAWTMFGDRFGRWQAGGMAVALAGIVVMMLPDLAAGGTTAAAGITLVVAATAGVALGNALTKRFASDVDPIAAAAVQLLVGGIPLFGLAYLYEPWTPTILDPRFLAIVATLGIAGTAATSALWIAVLRRSPLNAANAFNFLAPLLGVIISAVFLGERLGPVALSGIALTLGGIALASRRG